MFGMKYTPFYYIDGGAFSLSPHSHPFFMVQKGVNEHGSVNSLKIYLLFFYNLCLSFCVRSENKKILYVCMCMGEDFFMYNIEVT